MQGTKSDQKFYCEYGQAWAFHGCKKLSWLFVYSFFCLISLNFQIIFIHDRTIYCVDLFWSKHLQKEPFPPSYFHCRICTFLCVRSACGPSIHTTEPPFLNKIQNPGESWWVWHFPPLKHPQHSASRSHTCVHKTSAAHLNNACALLFFSASDPNLYRRGLLRNHQLLPPSSSRISLLIFICWLFMKGAHI